MRDGGHLGFRLRAAHVPVPADNNWGSDFFPNLKHSLKGNYRALLVAAKKAGLSLRFHVIYDDMDYGGGIWMLPYLGSGHEYEFEDLGRTWAEYADDDLEIIEADDNGCGQDGDPVNDLVWILPSSWNDKTRVPTRYAAYGNECTATVAYSAVVLRDTIPVTPQHEIDL